MTKQRQDGLSKGNSSTYKGPTIQTAIACCVPKGQEGDNVGATGHHRDSA